MKEYIVFNEKQNRVMINHDGFTMFSGEINNSGVSSLNFKLKKLNFIHKKLYEFFTGFVCVEYKTREVSSMLDGYDYMWLKFKDQPRTIKVWKEYVMRTPVNASRIYHSGRVMIKGIGDFTWSDFEEVVF